MGNNQSGEQLKNLSGQALIDILNARSLQGNSRSPDTVTYQGIARYLNEVDGKHMSWSPSHDLERQSRYLEVVGIVKKIGMSEEASKKLLGEAYKSLNGRHDALKKEGIPNPLANNQTQTIENNTNAPKKTDVDPIPEDLKRRAIALAINPHSYCSLSGMTTEQLLLLDKGTLSKVVHADESFVKNTKDHWNLAQQDRGPTASNLRDNYNEDLCTNREKLNLAGVSNRTPIDNFLKGKEIAIKAVEMGLDIYGDNNKVLKAFGIAAMEINNAMNSSNTLVGRGMDTISEQTMAFSPDGHSLGGGKKPHSN